MRHRLALSEEITLRVLGRVVCRSASLEDVIFAARGADPIRNLLGLPPSPARNRQLMIAVKKRSVSEATWMTDDDAGGLADGANAMAALALHKYFGESQYVANNVHNPIDASENLNQAFFHAQQAVNVALSRRQMQRLIGPKLGLSMLRQAALYADVDAAGTIFSQMNAEHCSRDHYHAAMAAAGRTFVADECCSSSTFPFAAEIFAHMAKRGLPASTATLVLLCNAISTDSQIDAVAELVAQVVSQRARRLDQPALTVIHALMSAIGRVVPAEGAAERAAHCFRTLNITVTDNRIYGEYSGAFLPAASRSLDAAKTMSCLRRIDGNRFNLCDAASCTQFVAGHCATTQDLLNCTQFYLRCLSESAVYPPAFVNTLLIAQSAAARAAPEISVAQVLTFNATLQRNGGRDSLTYAVALNDIARRGIRDLTHQSDRARDSVLQEALGDICRTLNLHEAELPMHPDTAIVLMQFLSKLYSHIRPFEDMDSTSQAHCREITKFLDDKAMHYLRLVQRSESNFSKLEKAPSVVVTVPVEVDLAELGGLIRSAATTVLDFYSLFSFFSWSFSSARRDSFKSILRRGGRILSPSETLLAGLQPSVEKVTLGKAAKPLDRSELAPRMFLECAVDRFRLRNLPTTSAFRPLSEEHASALKIWSL